MAGSLLLFVAAAAHGYLFLPSVRRTPTRMMSSSSSSSEISVRRCGLSRDERFVSDSWLRGVVWSAEVEKVLYDAESAFQRITVVETTSLGRALVLDGALQCAERDERGYHEFLTHVPLLRRGAFSLRRQGGLRVLVVGGGDGGIAREALKHEAVGQVDLVEIDPEVVAACRTFLPSIWPSDDNRLAVIHDDASKFVEACEAERYDLVVVDASDPVGPGASLYTREFYANVRRVLRRRGAAVVQAGSFWYLPRVLRTVDAGLRAAGFAVVRPYSCFTAIYPGGQWNLVCATKRRGDDPSRPHRRRATRFCRDHADLEFYDPQAHHAAFQLAPLAKRELAKPPPSDAEVAADLAEIYQL